MQIIKAPNELPTHRVNGIVPKSVFLAGSIEMGTAVDWQKETTERLSKQGVEYVFNPRRDDFDASQEQSKDNDYFYGQVSWELTALDIAETILMYFAPGTKSPISLLELGLYAQSGKLIVVCNNGFWREGNVSIVCERYGIPLYDILDFALMDKRFDYNGYGPRRI